MADEKLAFETMPPGASDKDWDELLLDFNFTSKIVRMRLLAMIRTHVGNTIRLPEPSSADERKSAPTATLVELPGPLLNEQEQQTLDLGNAADEAEILRIHGFSKPEYLEWFNYYHYRHDPSHYSYKRSQSLLSEGATPPLALTGPWAQNAAYAAKRGSSKKGTPAWHFQELWTTPYKQIFKINPAITWARLSLETEVPLYHKTWELCGFSLNKLQECVTRKFANTKSRMGLEEVEDDGADEKQEDEAPPRKAVKTSSTASASSSARPALPMAMPCPAKSLTPLTSLVATKLAPSKPKLDFVALVTPSPSPAVSGHISRSIHVFNINFIVIFELVVTVTVGQVKGQPEKKHKQPDKPKTSAIKPQEPPSDWKKAYDLRTPEQIEAAGSK